MIPTILSITKGKGRPVVLLHAFPLSHLMWEDFKAPSGYQLILPDFPGFGVTPLANKELTLAQAAQGLEKHLWEKGIVEPIILGGISMGGYWAMEFIRQFPSKVVKILFISTRPGIDRQDAKQYRLKMAERVNKEGVEFLKSTMVPGLLGRTTLSDKPEVAERLREWIQMTDPAAIALAQRAMAVRLDQNDLMSELKTPVCILAGQEDTLVPVAEAESLAKAIPSSRIQVLEHVGHLIPLENPERFQKILDEFV